MNSKVRLEPFIYTEHDEIQSICILAEYSFIFEAEATALLKALEVCKTSRCKSLICTDSHYVFEQKIINKFNSTKNYVKKSHMDLQPCRYTEQ